MALKGDAKFKGKLIRGLKDDIRNLVNFHASSWKSKNLHFHGLLLSNAYKVLDEKLQKGYGSWHWRVMQNLVNFNASNGRSENLHFDALLLSKVYYVWVIKVQRSYVSYHWRKMQNLRRNWFVLWKMTWGIRRILKQHSKVSKFELWWLVLSKACKALDEKVQKSYVSWHFRVIQRKNNS